MEAIVNAVKAADGTDSMAAAIRLLSAMLHRFSDTGGARERVLELGGHEALEELCVKAGGVGTDIMNFASEMAADLIDTFFDEDAEVRRAR
jgi:hypothetical protein